MRNINLTTESEVISPQDLSLLIGSCRIAKQIEWLDKYQWTYFLNAVRRPIVGRAYLREKLSGKEPQSNFKSPTWQLDTTQIK